MCIPDPGPQPARFCKGDTSGCGRRAWHPNANWMGVQAPVRMKLQENISWCRRFEIFSGHIEWDTIFSWKILSFLPQQSLTVVMASPLYQIISHHITSRHITSYHITSYHIASYHITPYHIISHHIISHHLFRAQFL